jgi:uncharacterized membrane protein
MATLLSSVLFGIKTGIEELFVHEKEGAIKTVLSGRPSAVTMTDFVLIAIAGIITLFHRKNIGKFLFWIGLAVSITGAIAILGYLIDQPILYYSIENINTAMAAHTALLFLIIGIGLLLLGKSNDKAIKKDNKR